ncbi:TetR/AcrR family transcriptional regulator [Actinocorallia aurantiaca]|uniref:TetR family transcriptional regulator C-terminal domain-containing protein n=1 Tax=Actinocorallia aurantiaca TaxID=46204 RepID=A0ABN3UPW3_9ACTN
MPRIVDHEARRRELTEALWRVIYRDGIETVSVRSVAAEAGCSPGALRHYFPEQKDLIVSAMDQMSGRAGERITTLDPAGTPVDRLLAYCEQLIPMDAERRFEAEAWLGFITRARRDADLKELSTRVQHTLRGFLSHLLDELGFDVGEAVRLHALVDGLTLHLLLYPEQLTPERAREQLRAHLVRLPRKDAGAAAPL